jgi:hypothetical protein
MPAWKFAREVDNFSGKPSLAALFITLATIQDVVDDVTNHHWKKRQR